jgi:hypothetical protein
MTIQSVDLIKRQWYNEGLVAADKASGQLVKPVKTET